MNQASKIRVFVSFDLEHDSDLYRSFLAESAAAESGFRVCGRSGGSPEDDLDGQHVRRLICEADEVVFICGEHTGASTTMSSELRMAQEERTPYFLLWGRREVMCTKPLGSKPAEGMYSWTPEILLDRISVTLRSAHAKHGERSTPMASEGST